MMCSTVPELQQDKRASARVLRLPCQCSIQPHPNQERPVFQKCSCAHQERPVFQSCSCAHLQAARVPELFLRPPTSGPSSRVVPAPTYKWPVFQRCSCAHLQAARVPELFLRPPTSGPSSREVFLCPTREAHVPKE